MYSIEEELILFSLANLIQFSEMILIDLDIHSFASVSDISKS